MKAELLAQLVELTGNEDPGAVRADVKSLVSRYNAETLREKKEQKAAWDEVEHEEGEEFVFSPNALDVDFEAAFAEFKEKDRIQREAVAAEQKKNLDVRKDLLRQFQELVSDEENIGKAFARFNELTEEWKSAGPVSGEKFKDVQDEYVRLRDEFFYNINIYKELKEHDLKINEKKKQELIDEVKGVSPELPIKELDARVRDLQSRWMEIGPSPRETYKEMADEFFGVCRELIGKIKEHFQSLQEEFDQNLAAKKELVDQLVRIVELEIQNHGTWKKKTDQVLELQKKWKEIGFARKGDNEQVWEEFRGLCDKFFDAKQAYYDARKDEQSNNKSRKESLIAQARELSQSDDWKETTDKLIGLQKEWKKVGSAAHYEEQKLWNDFRSACDDFFSRKSEHFGSMDQKQEVNLQAKLDLIAEISAYEMSGNKQEDIAALKDFSARWHEIGFVPKKNLQETYDAYNAALDVKYKELNVNESERHIIQYKERISGMKSGGNSENQLHKERTFIMRKMETLQSTIRQYENNMLIFTGKGAESMKREIEKKIKAAEREMEDLEKKLDLI
ncbi:MAG: DUF349 domain-containing protein [Flavobacteriales bacterium]|nr:DUF349 domain-containing protein [Flavobacteriales bacterium]